MLPALLFGLVLRLEGAVEVAGCGTAVDGERGAADEGTLAAHEELRDVRDLVRRAGAARLYDLAYCANCIFSSSANSST